ncbi:MAG: hypothetical protein K2J64_10085 [Desulfovibrio sp.]|nr:hypothetical protein [Desulfovibrio sp.]
MSPATQEYEILRAGSEELRINYIVDYDAWNDSPFAWIKTNPSRTIGKIGEQMISLWVKKHGFNVRYSPDTEADRIIEGKRAEIKFSTLWDEGFYKFQQIRDQNYDIMIWLGVSPHRIHCWVLTKDEVMDLWHIKHIIKGQHKGQEGTDTGWIKVLPAGAPYLFPSDGDLSSAIARLGELTGFTPKPL